MSLPLPENEVVRLDHLNRFRILDTPPERAFDDLTHLTAFICGTPIAFIGLMDSARLWFKSKIGWDIAEVPRDMCFCAHTILQSDVLIVPDTLDDRGRLAECPLATHGGIRFYAGVALMSSQGYPLGTLAAMDSIPRGLTQGQIDAMRRLARQAVSLIESRKFASDALNIEPERLGGNVDEALALRRSEERLQGIIGSAMDAIITLDSDQRIVLFNKAAEQIFRCAAAEAVGQTIDKFIPQRFRDAHREHIQEFAATGVTTRSMDSPGALFALRADGEEIPIEATISQVDTSGERLFTVILRDISNRLRMEAELRHAHKMEAIGRLAGGVAHEFNNFLGVILGYCELLSEEKANSETVAKHAAAIKTATQHASSLTRQLLAFSRKQVPEPQVLDLNMVIWESHNLLRRLVPANIEVVPVLASDIGKVKADAGQIRQILVNLLVNARDAMPVGGRLTIETSDVELDETFASQHNALQAGSYVLLSVTDSGAGMSAEARSHLFEPFYTTKEPGKGTGLGLSTVYGIVKQANAHITVESIEGKGTRFRIYFPRVEDSSSLAATELVPPNRTTRTATILVVEDETTLRRLLCLCLEKRNHKVLAARDGAEAIELFRQHADEIDLVVTDLMMPRMDGLELKRQIVALRGDVKFLFMSGYAEEILEQVPISDACSFLEKPFVPEELADKVARLIAGEIAA